MPYSETCRPLRTARSRRRMLCCLGPVKCCSRLPNWSGATTRRSIDTPLCVRARAAFSPLLEALSTRSISARAAASAGGAAGGRRRVVGGGDEVEVLAAVARPPHPAGDLDAHRRRMAAQLGDQRV